MMRIWRSDRGGSAWRGISIRRPWGARSWWSISTVEQRRVSMHIHRQRPVVRTRSSFQPTLLFPLPLALWLFRRVNERLFDQFVIRNYRSAESSIKLVCSELAAYHSAFQSFVFHFHHRIGRLGSRACFFLVWCAPCGHRKCR